MRTPFIRTGAVAHLAAMALLAGVTACDRSPGDVWTFRTKRPLLPHQLQAYTPVVHDHGIYFCGGDGVNRTAALTALNVDGTPRWRYPLGSCAAAPILVGGTVVAFSRPRPVDLTLHGVDAATGALRWQKRLGLDRGHVRVGTSLYLSMASTDLFHVSTVTGDVKPIDVPRAGRRPWWLAAEDDHLVFGEGTAVWTLSPPDMVPIASATLQSPVGRVSHALVVGDLLVLQEQSNRITVYDRHTGRMRWRRQWRRLLSGPTAAHGLLVVNTFGPNRYELEAMDVTTGERRWSIRNASSDEPAAAPQRLYAAGRRSVMVIDPVSGTVLHRYPAWAEVISTPVPMNDLLLFGTIDGELHAVRLPATP